MKMKKTCITIILLLAAVMLVLTGCGRKFDASGYVTGILDIAFQDETSQAMATMGDVTEKELHEKHQEIIYTFVENNITNELTMNEIKETEFYVLCEQIFSTMKYQVGEASKVGKRQYEVPVEISPSDVFVRFGEALEKDAAKIAAAMEAGEYKGTEDEIMQQVLDDIINHSYELLSVAHQDMEFGEKTTVILTVESNDENEYAIKDGDIDNLIVKILRLDEIQH